MWKSEQQSSIQSSARHVEPCVKSGRPLPKAKYYPVTDSAKYCEGKVKRTPGGEWKRTWNPVFTNCGSESDRVLFVERSGELSYVARLSSSGTEPKRERVLKGRHSHMRKARNRVTYPWPGWRNRKRFWRTGTTSVEKGGYELWIAEKFQSNPEIAGSPRNSFRASLYYNLRR